MEVDSNPEIPDGVLALLDDGRLGVIQIYLVVCWLCWTMGGGCNPEIPGGVLALLDDGRWGVIKRYLVVCWLCWTMGGWV